MSALLVRQDGTAELLPDQDLTEATKTLHAEEEWAAMFAELQLTAGDRVIAEAVILPSAEEVNPKASRVVLLLLGVHVQMKGPVVFRSLEGDVAMDLLESLKDD